MRADSEKFPGLNLISKIREKLEGRLAPGATWLQVGQYFISLYCLGFFLYLFFFFFFFCQG
jgi:hypothetical protein